MLKIKINLKNTIYEKEMQDIMIKFYLNQEKDN